MHTNIVSYNEKKNEGWVTVSFLSPSIDFWLAFAFKFIGPFSFM